MNNLKLKQRIAQITFSGHRVNDDYTLGKRRRQTSRLFQITFYRAENSPAKEGIKA